MLILVNQHSVFYEGCELVDGIRQYLISVIAAAIICSVIISFTGKKGTSSAMIKLLCGLFLSVTVASPWVGIKIHDISTYFQVLHSDANSIVSDGQIAAREETSAIIKSKTEAYILDKASSLGLAITVNVSLDDGQIPAPVSVTLQGKASPYAQQHLGLIIADELGIPKERQTWI